MKKAAFVTNVRNMGTHVQKNYNKYRKLTADELMSRAKNAAIKLPTFK